MTPPGLPESVGIFGGDDSCQRIMRAGIAYFERISPRPRVARSASSTMFRRCYNWTQEENSLTERVIIMKAIRVHEFGEPEVMHLEDVPELTPGPAEVVVRLHAVGVNPVDAYIRSGMYRPALKLPYTPGLDGAGIISAVGSEVKHRQVGQRVYVAWSLSGTYAEEVLCKEFQTHPLPGEDQLRPGRGRRRPLWSSIPGAVPAGSRSGRGVASGPWRQRRGGDCRSAACPGSRSACNRHRRHG